MTVPRDRDSRDRGNRPGPSRHNRFHDAGKSTVTVPSIIGTVPEHRPSDFDVFAKYDFNRRIFDTSELVINRVKEKILVALQENQAIMVEGFTGCGKTTQVPQFILDEAQQTGTPCRIVVTQPRRIAAISVASRVSQERGWALGGLVGYQVGMDRRASEDTRVTYMTTGVLLQLLIGRKNVSEWTHIIVDEVHERDLDTDLLLLVIKKILVDTNNQQTKIILMSATLNPEKFAKYFPLYVDGVMNGEAERVIVDVPVRFEIKEFFIEDMAKALGYAKFSMEGLEEPKVHQDCFEICMKTIETFDKLEEEEAGRGVHRMEVKRGAVLVFLPGLLEIESLFKILVELDEMRQKDHKTRGLKWMILPLHSTITTEEQQRVFVTPRPNYRKIILATNIAESSITVSDVKYVMDFCLTKNLRCDPITNYTCLRLDWASKNQCIQRRGRCGRVAPGVCYRLVTKSFYLNLQQEAEPEMCSSSLESVVLQVKLLDMGSPLEVLSHAVDPPEASNVARAVANLKEIGAMTILKNNQYDRFDGELTFMGRVLSRLPIDIRLGRLILLGYAFDCLEEAIVIAAGLSVKSPFAYPYTKRLDAYMSKLTWASNEFSDCIALLNLYTTWYRRHQLRDFHGYGDEKNWSRKYFVQITSLREMKVLVDELHKRLATCGIDFSTGKHSRPDQNLMLKVVIAGAFYPNYFSRLRPDEREYSKDISRDLLGMERFSSVMFQGFPSEQPVNLYKKIIAARLAYDNCIPFLTFQGTKMVVTFDSRGNSIGPYSRAVYRMIKWKYLRNIISFKIWPRDVAQEKLEQKQEELAKIKPTPCPRQVAMPGLKTSRVQAFVTHLENPSEFFVVMKKDEVPRQELIKLLKKHEEGFNKIRHEYCVPGQFCVAKLKGEWMRARVDADKTEQGNRRLALVYFLDHGQSMWLPFESVNEVGDDLLKLKVNVEPPAMAVKCRLAKTSASVRTACVWSPEAISEFDKFLGESHIVLEIYSVVQAVMNVFIKKTGADDEETINEILVKKKLADYNEETDPSQKNNEIRWNIRTEGRDDILECYSRLEAKQGNCQLPERMVDTPVGTSESLNTVALRGPFTPLEMHFNSLCHSAHLKQVMTESSSVNSVMLDQNPDRPTAYLMVASFVSIAARSGHIMARETTLMPAIPSLCGLLAMLFCPKVELRVDDDYTHYTGCVTGLGIDPAKPKGGSIYPDHDMEIVFDAHVDNKDISTINSIRSSLNNILSQERMDKSALRGERNSMRKEAMLLLERERKTVQPEWSMCSHQWNMLHPSRLMVDPDETLSERESAKVFPMHIPVKLGPIANEAPNRPRYF